VVGEVLFYATTAAVVTALVIVIGWSLREVISIVLEARRHRRLEREAWRRHQAEVNHQRLGARRATRSPRRGCGSGGAEMPVRKGGTFIVGDDRRRFWSKTRAAGGGCIEWTGCVDKDGYGKFTVGGGKSQRHLRSHRWIYEVSVGPLGRALLLHSCDNPRCVALQHLSPGTQKQNVSEAFARGRRTLPVRKAS
jgi:hypothetical protein